LHPDRYITSTGNDQSSGRTIRQLYITFIQVVTAQLAALPEGVFDTELPELDIWLLGELDALRNNLREAVRPGVASAWSGEGNKGLQARSDVETAWDDLIKAGQRFRWELEPLCLRDTNCDEESEEEGEYAPVVVDM
jgi:A1 cistron-splicing factor AAR2